MNYPNIRIDEVDTNTSACESTESKISVKEEREFVRNNLSRQLATSLALSANEIVNKLMGRTIKDDRHAVSPGGNHKMTSARVIADDVPANLDHKQFLYWHVQHQKVAPTMRVYAARDGVGPPGSTVSKMFLNMLRLERVVIYSEDREPVFLALIEYIDANAPSRVRRVVRGFRSYSEANRSYCRSREALSQGNEVSHEDSNSEGYALGELMDRHRPGWRLDNSLCDETKIEMDQIARFIAGTSIPRFKSAAMIAKALGVSANTVLSACRKSKSEAGLAGKKSLATWRELRGLSVKDLAFRSGVCVLSIKKYERGISPRLLQTKNALAKALNVGLRNVMWESGGSDKSDLESGSQEGELASEEVKS